MRFIDATVEYQGFWGSFWDLIWWFFAVFIFVSYLFALFAIVGDIFRDNKLGGWGKAIWLLFLITRGGSMGERQAVAAQQYKAAQDDYIKSVAGTSAPDQIAQAKSLLDSGAITQAEFEALKAKALA